MGRLRGKRKPVEHLNEMLLGRRSSCLAHAINAMSQWVKHISTYMLAEATSGAAERFSTARTHNCTTVSFLSPPCSIFEPFLFEFFFPLVGLLKTVIPRLTKNRH